MKTHVVIDHEGVPLFTGQNEHEVAGFLLREDITYHDCLSCYSDGDYFYHWYVCEGRRSVNVRYNHDEQALEVLDEGGLW